MFLMKESLMGHHTLLSNSTPVMHQVKWIGQDLNLGTLWEKRPTEPIQAKLPTIVSQLANLALYDR